MTQHTYQAEATRSGRWWYVHITGVPLAHTQAKTLADVAPMATDLLVELGVVEPGAPLIIEVVPQGRPRELAAQVEEARQAAKAAADRAHATAADVARQLRADGLPVSDVGLLLNRTHAWVSGVTKPKEPPTSPPKTKPSRTRKPA